MAKSRHLQRGLPTSHVSRASKAALPRLRQPGTTSTKKLVKEITQIPSKISENWDAAHKELTDPSRLACSEDIIPKVTRSIFCRLKGKYTSEKGVLVLFSWWRDCRHDFLPCSWRNAWCKHMSAPEVTLFQSHLMSRVPTPACSQSQLLSRDGVAGGQRGKNRWFKKRNHSNILILDSLWSGLVWCILQQMAKKHKSKPWSQRLLSWSLLHV